MSAPNASDDDDDGDELNYRPIPLIQDVKLSGLFTPGTGGGHTNTDTHLLGISNTTSVQVQIKRDYMRIIT